MTSKRYHPLVFHDLPEDGDTTSHQASSEAEDFSLFDPEPAATQAPPEPRTAAPTPPQSALPIGSPPAEELAAWGRWAYPVAIAAALVWAGGLTAFVLGFQTRFGAFNYDILQWVVIGCLAALPAIFILLAAMALRQGARLALETRKARAMAQDLAIPAALAADQTAGAMEAMRREIERASSAAVEAQHPIAALREALAEESRKLADTAAEAQETGRKLAETLGRERIALGELAGALHAQATEAAEALALQSRVVGDASDLAQVQLQEAQAALAARAADLAIAAGDAGEAAIAAGEQLTRQVERLESAGESMAQRMNRLQLSIAQEREELGAVSEGLRLDQEDLAAQMETRRAQLAEAAAEARLGANSIGEAAEAGAESLRSMIAGAAEEVRRLAQTAQREQAALDAQARTAVGLFSGAVAEERAGLEAQTRAAIEQLAAAAEEARLAAAGHVEAAAEAAAAQTSAARAKMDALASETAARIDHLGEAAFAVGQKADAVFDARMASARRMIEQSAALVEESGHRSAERIEAGLATARTALQDMQGLLAEIDARFDALPAEAQSRADAVRQAVERGVGDLTAAARRAAEETQAIDASFQERVRRNYEMLAEAVRLMGRVAGAAVPLAPEPAAPAPVAEPPPTPAPAAIAPAPAAPASAPKRGPIPPVQSPVARPAAHQPERAAATERAPAEVRPAIAVGDRSIHVPLNEQASAARASDPLRPAALSEPARRAEPLGAASAAAGLRPRLRLTPTPTDEAVSALFEPQSARRTRGDEARDEAPHAPDEWTWKDLLSSMDDPIDDDALAEKLMGEISALGIDAGALLPRARIDEIGAVLQAGDAGGAREVVRRLAPAAVRRLSRRVLTDKVLRAESDRYVRRYEQLLADASGRDREGYMTAALLGSEPGRAFLLLDAAVGDLN